MLDAGFWMLVEDSVFSGDAISNCSYFVLSSIEYLATTIASPEQPS